VPQLKFNDMELKHCKDFTDVYHAVVNYGADLKKAIRKAATQKIAQGTKIVAGDSEYGFLYRNYPEHREVINKLAGI
jgi:hypothetical protein